MPVRDNEPEDITKTDPTSTENQASDERLGIFWVSPAERFAPLSDGMTIGRSAAASVVLEGGSVSRIHAKLRLEGTLWVIEDQGSKNGTRVNGAESAAAPLQDQTVLRLGDWIGVVCRVKDLEHGTAPLFREIVPGWIAGPPGLSRLGPVERLAACDISIALVGETGTGKEVVARGIHRLSGRAGRFVALNCAAIPEAVAESQLFGHLKGAFTGAARESEGFVAAAAGGTLFLDEIGDLPPAIQAKLLRVLEERTVTPLGSTRPIPVDFRLIAASQEPLERLVEEGTFRGDLHARISGAAVELTPLRQRREEIVRLFAHATADLGSTAKVLSPAFVERLCVYDWPFNVRELVQLSRLLSISQHGTLSVEDLPERYSRAPAEPPPARTSEPPSVPAGIAFASGRREAWMLRHAQELARLKAALDRSGNVSQAARETGIPRYRALRLLAADAEAAQVRPTES
jgi:transcriptional regulator with AAA-type ATPase domain